MVTGQPGEISIQGAGQLGEKAHAAQWKRQFRRFKRNKLSVVGATVIVFLALVAIVGPFVAPYPDDATGAVHMANRLQPPSSDNWLGTDQVGRDVLTRLLVGSRMSLGAGFIVLIVATSIGTTIGVLSGFFGGAIDLILQRITDVFLTIPGLILAMAVAAALGPSLFNVIIAISLVWWPGYSRLARGEVLSTSNEVYVEAARAVGAPRSRIILRHVLPNITTPILVKSTMDVGFAVLTLASLGFIGLGSQPPDPDWGKMIADGRRYLPESWWLTVFPGAAIFLTVFAFNLLGDGIRDVFDPRSRD